MCWPANVVGAFFIAVLVFDMIQKNYGDLPYHAMAGVVMTFLFWLVCSFVSVSVSGALLIVPAVFLTVFLFTVWFMNESLKQRGCCMNCNGKCQGKAYLVKREQKLNAGDVKPEAPRSLWSLFSTGTETCKSTLTATSAT